MPLFLTSCVLAVAGIALGIGGLVVDSNVVVVLGQTLIIAALALFSFVR